MATSANDAPYPAINACDLDFLPVPVVTLTPDGLIADCNTAALRLFGRERVHMLGLPIVVFVHREEVSLLTAHLHRCRNARGEKVESEVNVRAGNKVLPMTIISSAMQVSNRIVFQTALIDLTERKERERQVEEERQYNELFEFVPEPLLVLDPNLNVMRTNAALRERLRCTREEIEGTALDQFELLRWKSRELFRRLSVAATGGPPVHHFPCEVVLVGLGHQLNFLASARMLRRTAGKPTPIMVAFQDVTQQTAGDRERFRLMEDLRRLNCELEQRVVDRTGELRELSRRLVHAQETERGRIAETLHNDFGQILTGLNLVLKRAREKCDLNEIAEAEALVADLLHRVRGLSTDLRPHVLDNLGLAVALRWHVKKYIEQTKIQVNLGLRGVPRDLPADVATCAFRVVQEALTNAARHAKAKRLVVDVVPRANFIRIRIRDNGCGFNAEKLPPGASGLTNLRERVRLAGGEFTITSQPGDGTSLQATLPIPPQ